MRSPQKPKSDLPTVLLHWAIVLALVFSLITGLRIAADMPDAAWARAVTGILPQGNVILWHLLSGLALLGLVGAYVMFLRRAGLTRRIALDRAWRAALVGRDAKARWRAINVLVYWLAFLAVLIAGITGIMMDLIPGFAPFAIMATIHQTAAWSIVFYIVIHIGALILLGGWGYLLKILRPQPAYGAAAAIALLSGGVAAAAFYGLENSVGGGLTVVKTTTPPTLDGRADDPIWREASSVAIPTNRGANLPGGDVTVTVRGAHDGEYFYGLFQWPDTTQSFKHLPLVKHEDGWRVSQTEYGIQDEDSYYEDKFGVMLSDGGGLAGDNTIHLGNRPLSGRPGPSGGRGLHYTTDGGIVDVWHWKAVRTGNPIMTQIDDNYFGPPMEPKASGRYTGGYSKDPNEGGGFSMNWTAYSDGVVTPKRLPRDPAMLGAFQDVNLEPTVGDAQHLFLPLADTVPYDPALDTYPVGTILPAVLVDAPFQGDRGDVTAVTHWADGMWTMEVKRRLDTGSEYDVPFALDGPTYLWVAVFDHAQTRHSRHLRPVTVELQQ